MIEMDIDFVEPGDVLARTHVFKNFESASSTTVDLRAGFALTKTLIDKLKNVYNVRTLWIEDKTKSISESSTYIDDVEKNRITTQLVANMKEVCEEKILDIKKIEQVASQIIEMIADNLRKNNGVFSSINSLFTKVNDHDLYTFEHSVNTSIYSVILSLNIEDIIHNYKSHLELKGINNPITNNPYETIAINLLLHDIGKTTIPLNILNKEGKLTNEEFEEVQKHPFNGFHLLREIDKNNREKGLNGISSTFWVGALYHHQNWDGTGYPPIKMSGGARPLKEKEIPLIGRISAVVDLFDALTTKRPYRKKMHTLNALQIMSKELGKKLDPIIGSRFIQLIDPFPVGSTIKLNNGDLGLIVRHKDDNKLMPMVRPYARRVQNKDGSFNTIKLIGTQEYILGTDVGFIIDDKEYKKIEI